MDSIQLQSIKDIQNRWGVQAGDYKVSSQADAIDFQDVMVRFSKQRAVAVEGEVEPLSTRMQQRNERLDELGKALAELTKVQTSFDSDAEGNRDMTGWLSNETGAVLESLGYKATVYSTEKEWNKYDNDERADFYKAGWRTESQYSINKQMLEGVISRVKSEIDGLNNEAQSDMTRLQSLVDRRDESYSTATNLMTSISDTRSNVIRNM